MCSIKGRLFTISWSKSIYRVDSLIISRPHLGIKLCITRFLLHIIWSTIFFMMVGMYLSIWCTNDNKSNTVSSIKGTIFSIREGSWYTSKVLVIHGTKRSKEAKGKANSIKLGTSEETTIGVVCSLGQPINTIDVKGIAI